LLIFEHIVGQEKMNLPQDGDFGLRVHFDGDGP
jgi:hypothetical protein